MRWPFRRSSGETSSPATQAGQTEVQDAAPAVESVAGQTPAWRELPAGMTVLGSMPSTMQAGFSRTLPSRWRTAPALGPLGHDVRTDVPGGLVSGAARTVDPLDTRPADFVWRLPDPAEPATAPPGGARTLIHAESSRPGVALRATAAPRVTASATAPSSSLPTAPVTTQQSAPITSQSPVPSTQPSVPSSAGATEPSTGAGARSLSPLMGGTTQTRQALPDAEAAVEARDPRPVPADVTDGPTAAAPDRGVHAEPNPGTPESPPGAPGASLGTLYTPREARSGPDPQGSAPAVAPLVSRNPLPRSSAQPLVGGPGAQASAADGDPLGHALVAAPNAPAELPSNDFAGSTRADVGAYSDESRGPAAGVDPATQDAESTTSTSEVGDRSQSSSTGAAAASTQPAAAQQAAVEPQQMPQSAAQPTAITPAPPAPTLRVPTPQPTRTAPLISATRFAPVATPISVLQPPAAPVDQPVREAVSVIGGYATTAAASAIGPAAVPPSVASAVQAPVSAPMASAPAATSAATALATMTGAVPSRPGAPRAQAASAGGQARNEPSAFSDAASAIEDSAHEVGRMISRPGTSTPTAAPSPADAKPTPHDPAALDVLARQLYGRFSRHLAGELLIDRERSQFLTDLH